MFSASYALTNDQLHQALNSNQFILNSQPYDRYGIIESAAASIYTRCGFKKIMPEGNLEDLLVHHLSNKYAYSHCRIDFELFKEQIRNER
ncbi:MAG: hypothetical protein M3461_18155 [Pseudomonadota bacterium]|nr:hypothetical protein [Pseudomonadota bacterium]